MGAGGDRALTAYWLDLRHVKNRVYLEGGRELETEGGGIDNPLDGVWADVTGSQLPGEGG